MEVNKKFIIKVQNNEFIKFEGLLDLFHRNGGKEIYTKRIQQEPLIIQATVKGEVGTFQGIGDADEKNTNRLIANHKIRMAETRAIARALRFYNNIGICSAEELGGDEKVYISPDMQKNAQKGKSGFPGTLGGQLVGANKPTYTKTGPY